MKCKTEKFPRAYTEEYPEKLSNKSEKRIPKEIAKGIPVELAENNHQRSLRMSFLRKKKEDINKNAGGFTGVPEKIVYDY